MTADALRAIREKIQELGETATFADLSQPLLFDLALGWHEGRPFAAHAAELLSRIDGIPPDARVKELSGRALLTLLERRRTGAPPESPAAAVRLLADPEVDEGDAEGAAAFDRREEEYVSLAALTPPTSPAEFARDAAAAFDAARSRADAGRGLPPDPIGPSHPLALLGQRLPPGLRAHFHATRDAAVADAAAWQFVLVSKALARHREQMEIAGVLDGSGTEVPARLVAGLLATDLGALARTALVE